MAVYILSSDASTIDFGHTSLLARVEVYLGPPVHLYRPLTFVEHSGFSETVREEIQLVLANQPVEEPPQRAFDDFVEAWNLRAHLDYRVLDLSGGWRKFLGLALFMNRSLPARLLLDTTSHLSDARMETLLDRAADGGDAVFCEYDSLLLRRLRPSLPVLNDDGTTVSEADDS
ncbi:MAG: hypothetical protein HQ485_00265 [Acidobacteria bacterium]|nr:hypothetical protein [Acidobacteriota bacterium]